MNGEDLPVEMIENYIGTEYHKGFPISIKNRESFPNGDLEVEYTIKKDEKEYGGLAILSSKQITGLLKKLNEK